MNNNKNRSAFPLDGNSAGHPDTLGLTKREYFAGMYANAANECMNDLMAKDVLKILGLPDETPYEYPKHYIDALVKIQLLLVDELLKRLEP
jgi:hypothetical protein